MESPNASMTVPARLAEVNVCAVSAGETWRFEARGEWIDGYIHCDAAGYRFALADFLDIRPGVRTAPWFALVGFVGDEVFTIGTGVVHTFQQSGQLKVCANDLAG